MQSYVQQVKIKQEKDEIFLGLIRKINCLCCGAIPPVDACHIKSRGSGGGDEWWNVIPMCRKCHTEQHSIGWLRFIKKHSHINEHLSDLGWENNLGNLFNKNSIK